MGFVSYLERVALAPSEQHNVLQQRHQEVPLQCTLMDLPVIQLSWVQTQDQYAVLLGQLLLNVHPEHYFATEKPTRNPRFLTWGLI